MLEVDYPSTSVSRRVKAKSVDECLLALDRFAVIVIDEVVFQIAERIVKKGNHLAFELVSRTVTGALSPAASRERHNVRVTVGHQLTAAEIT